MENQNQHYGTHESMYVEDPNEQKEFLHSAEEEKPVVTGDPSETAEDHDLNQNTRAAGMTDMDDLLEEADASKEEPDPDDDEDDDDDDVDDPESDDPELDDDDEDFEPDDDDLDDIDPDDIDPDDLDLDDDDVIDDDLNTDDKDPGLDEDDDNGTYLK